MAATAAAHATTPAPSGTARATPATGDPSQAVQRQAVLPQTPRFRRIGVADGLPSSTVFQLAQDRAGYLWIATGDGLARFDGVDMQVYRHHPRTDGALPGNVVQALHVADDDRIWVAVEGGGVSVLDGARRDFAPVRAAGSHDVWAIAGDVAGNVFVGGFGDGVRKLDRDGRLLAHWSAGRQGAEPAGKLASAIVLSLLHDGAGGMYVATAAGVDHVDGGGAVTAVAGVPPGIAFALHRDAAGRLWIGHAAGLFLRERADGPATRVDAGAALAADGVSSILRDTRGGLWLGTRRGLWHRAAAAGGFRDLSTAFAPRPGAAPAALLAVFEDHEQGLWFATRGAGLARLPATWRNFSVLPARDDVSLAAALRVGAEADDGALWFAGDAGLARLRPAALAPEWIAGADAFGGRAPWSLLALGESIWIGHQAALSRFDLATGVVSLRRATDAVEPLPDGVIDLLVGDGEGGFWLSAYGAGVQHRDVGGALLFEARPGDGSGLVHADLEQLALAPDGVLWLAGGDGLLAFDPDRRRFEQPQGAPTQRVHAIAFDATGRLWAQSMGKLEAFAGDRRRLHRVHLAGVDDGLPAIATGGLAIDAAGDAWLSTSRGLLRYRPDTRELRSYGVRDGLPSPEFSDRPLLRSADNRIAAAGGGGMVLFDPARLEQLPGSPRLVLEHVGLRRGGETLRWQPPLPALLHDDSELEVVARLLSFADPAGHRYRSLLRPLDGAGAAAGDDGDHGEWLDHGAQGGRRIGRLEPGRHRLEIVASNADGRWSPQPLRLEFEVLPPWWRTTPALLGWLLAGALLLATAAALLRWRLRRLHARELAEQQRQWALRASEAKSRFLATMGHEVRTPMTGVLGMTELLLDGPLDARQRHYAEGIRQSGELMLRVVNDALDLARIEAGRLELAEAPFACAALLHDVAVTCAALAARKGLAFHVDIADGAPEWLHGDALRLQQVLLNLCGNALKFTAAGSVRLQAAGCAPPETVCFAVVDTGPGLTTAEQARLFERFAQASPEVAARHGGSGLGLAICGELVRLMGGRIALDSTIGQGTRVRVWLPLRRTEAPGAAGAAGAAPAARPAAGSGALRILLVEDDAAVAEVMAELLRRGGHRVVHAAHALEALAAWQPDAFDLGLLDLDLPGLDGCTLAAMLRTRGARLPLLALSARVDAEAEALALAAGMQAFLRKPVAAEALLAAVQAAMVGRQAAVAVPG